MNNQDNVSQLRKHTLHPGAWLSIGAPVIAELVTKYPYDWILFDMEHGYITDSCLLANFQAAKSGDLSLIVRPGKMDTALIGRILDWGAAGIMLPHVDTADEAIACLRAMQYPPGGNRGYSSGARSFGFGVNTSDKGDLFESPVFMVQIESEKAVENASSIAAINGVDVLFIGPADLKLDLSSRKNYSDKIFESMIGQVISAAKQHNKQVGIVAKTNADFAKYAALGITCITFGSDMQFLKEGLGRSFD